MTISKIDLRFIKKFLASITVTKVEMFSLEGKSFLSDALDKSLQNHDENEIFTAGGHLYIPIVRQGQKSFVLRIDNEDSDPKIFGFAESVKNMLEESLNYIHPRNRPSNIDMLDDFLVELLIREPFSLSDNLSERANLLNFDYTIPRMIVLVDIIHFKSVVRHSSDKIEVQEKLNGVHRILKNSITSFSENFAYLYDDKFVLFKTQNDHLDDDLLAIREEIKKEMGLTTQFIVSRMCTALPDNRREFKKLTELHQVFGRKNLQMPLFRTDDYQIELMLQNIDDETSAFFSKDRKEKILKIRQTNEELLDTLVHFFKNNMDTKLTAEKMFIHKNTVYYRIKKLSQLLMSIFSTLIPAPFYFFRQA